MLKITNDHRPVSPPFAIPHFEEMFFARRLFLDQVERAITSGSNLETFVGSVLNQ